MKFQINTQFKISQLLQIDENNLFPDGPYGRFGNARPHINLVNDNADAHVRNPIPHALLRYEPHDEPPSPRRPSIGSQRSRSSSRSPRRSSWCSSSRNGSRRSSCSCSRPSPRRRHGSKRAGGLRRKVCRNVGWIFSPIIYLLYYTWEFEVWVLLSAVTKEYSESRHRINFYVKGFLLWKMFSFGIGSIRFQLKIRNKVCLRTGISTSQSNFPDNVIFV